MAEKPKLPILIVLILLMVVSLLLAFAEYHLLLKEKTKSVALLKDLEGLKAKEIQAEKELEESKKKVSDLLAQLEEVQGKVDSLNKALSEEKKATEDALTQVKQMGNYIEKQKNLKADLESKLDSAEIQVDNALKKLQESETKKTELEQKIKDLEAQIENAQISESQQDEKVELGTIQVAPDMETVTSQESSAPVDVVSESSQVTATQEVRADAKEGKVLVVNKDYNFIVINLGGKDDVKVGDVFSVYHNNKNIGDVKVEKIHDSMAAADFLNTDMKDQVREGDKIVQK